MKAPESTSDRNRLPISAAAHSLLRKQFEPMPDSEMAKIDFGPWELLDLCKIPTAKQWKVKNQEVPRVLATASKMLRHDKAGLMASSAKLEPEALGLLLGSIADWTLCFRMHLAMLEAVQDRMVVALAALAEQDTDGDRA